ncbi:MAG: DUF3108 domain-containing protein [Thiofilum sp.]|uniref:DUF3108 domain-containing protein n=1 Tax=Thiofilum sp. TaxID=2212733 RepID=UPI0025F41523|nr:DUF3108 domain-containing protein [Thiofilum sp.]MBK8453018.1 DUF3108 domain-containing protein [Thiofilum sp.]
MLRPHYFCGLILLGLSTYSTTALAELKSYQATYQVVKSGLTLGTMNTQIQIAGSHYNYTRQTQANGLAAMISGDRLTEQAQGTLKGAQLLPKSYLYDHKNKRKERRDQFQFNNSTQVTGQKNGESYALNVPAGTLDPLSMELKLMDDLATNRPLNYRVTEKGELKSYQIQKLGNEQLTVPAGQFNTVKVQVARSGNERQTTFWLAPTLNYAPVKMRHNEEGDIIETQLLSHSAR